MAAPSAPHPSCDANACVHCGGELPLQALFCGECGTRRANPTRRPAAPPSAPTDGYGALTARERRDVDTRSVTTRSASTSSRRDRRARDPLPIPPKRQRPSGLYGAGIERSPTPVVGEVDSPPVRTLSHQGPEAAPAGDWAPFGAENHLRRADSGSQPEAEAAEPPNEATVIALAPQAPAPYWDAPPKGDTVIGPPPIHGSLAGLPNSPIA